MAAGSPRSIKSKSFSDTFSRAFARPESYASFAWLLSFSRRSRVLDESPIKYEISSRFNPSPAAFYIKVICSSVKIIVITQIIILWLLLMLKNLKL